MEAKKLINLRILQVLERYSDADHPLTQQQIISYLERDFDLTCERKAVGRNISFLREADYDISSDGRGVWLAERRFEKSEIQMLIDSVMSSRFVDSDNTKKLIEKLRREGGEYFGFHQKNVVNIDEWQKTPNKELFWTIEVIDEAIEHGGMVRFFYNHYGLDKTLKKRKSDKYQASPYHLILRNQRYYLVANVAGTEDLRTFRLDLITGIEPINRPSRELVTLPGYEKGVKLGELMNKLPYMFLDIPERIVFIAKESLINDIIDWFGFNFDVKKLKETVLTDAEGGDIEVALTASPRAIRYWFLQYGNCARAISPSHLVDMLKGDIARMAKNYGFAEKSDVRQSLKLDTAPKLCYSNYAAQDCAP